MCNQYIGILQFTLNLQMGIICSCQPSTSEQVMRQRENKERLERFRQRFEERVSFKTLIQQIQQRRRKISVQGRVRIQNKMAPETQKQIIDQVNILLELLYRMHSGQNNVNIMLEKEAEEGQQTGHYAHHNVAHHPKGMIPLELVKQPKIIAQQKLIQKLTLENSELKYKQKQVLDLMMHLPLEDRGNLGIRPNHPRSLTVQSPNICEFIVQSKILPQV